MKINIVSRCWCCDRKEEETMTHLFLTALIAYKLWRLIHSVSRKPFSMEEIREIMKKIRAKITHIFREGNSLADSLANIVIESQAEHQYSCFQELPLKERRILNADKAQIPTLRIITHAIIPP
ncbi:hypothetical protein R3W88_024094 [Solanum pinnatisectum]|uniref:Reverse transcriptase zinc-binding domain-containing protein n=1 Tax=Solanum pinnatisectum TaxID=50273 RepID=A0AAV9LZK8_9SOLN|nr:hypothetical protein R3W88_024094 [Solanum pinnatisectum]